MMVLVVRNVRPGFRGRLTRWLVQPQPGVYLGHLSGRVRDRLWEAVCAEVDEKGGSAVLISPARNEQGYVILTRGEPPKEFVDFDGLTLPKTPRKAS
ncbi:MAG TPA: type I-E CRISPR-associated endoribonuclease Cas2e [Phycisphaerales bacterium]|nr:type I-E CRISPR-associated endoribonuclease Cas2e [Phycisphaerales bacterium]